MLYLLLAILSSAMISVIMRFSSNKTNGRSMLAVNYLTCLLLAVLSAEPGVFLPGRLMPGDGLVTAGMGAVNGALYLAGFMLLQFSVRENGLVLSSLFMKLGLLVPMAVSVFLFKEIPTPLQIVGFLAAVGAIVLLNSAKDTTAKAASGKMGSGMSLILLLLAGGGGDAMSKVFQMTGPAGTEALFLLCTFAAAFLFCLVPVIRNKERPGKAELLFGALVGVPNFFSAKFLLGALERLPAVIVYPTYSVATILAVTAAGMLLFREKLSKRQIFAGGIILAALVLLNV